ncbi:MAG: MFS transporter [Nitriliruptorales bacterium]|nr:MFS transporter [Nitriliruptorales bacterium]
MPGFGVRRVGRRDLTGAPAPARSARGGQHDLPVPTAAFRGVSRPPSDGHGILYVLIGALPLYLVSAQFAALERELALSAFRLGVVTAVYFGLAAAVATPVGRTVHRVGATTGLRIGACVSAAANVVVFTAGEWWLLLVAAGLAGLANAFMQVSTNVVLARDARYHRQGVSFGAKQGAIPLSSMVAGVLLPVVGVIVGWRWPFALAAVIALAVSFVAPPVSPAPRTVRDVDDRAWSPSAGLGWLAVGGACGGAAGNALSLFFVPSAVAVGVAEPSAGAALAVPGRQPHRLLRRDHGRLAGIVGMARTGVLHGRAHPPGGAGEGVGRAAVGDPHRHRDRARRRRRAGPRRQLHRRVDVLRCAVPDGDRIAGNQPALRQSPTRTANAHRHVTAAANRCSRSWSRTVSQAPRVPGQPDRFLGVTADRSIAVVRERHMRSALVRQDGGDTVCAFRGRPSPDGLGNLDVRGAENVSGPGVEQLRPLRLCRDLQNLVADRPDRGGVASVDGGDEHVAPAVDDVHLAEPAVERHRSQSRTQLRRAGALHVEALDVVWIGLLHAAHVGTFVHGLLDRGGDRGVQNLQRGQADSRVDGQERPVGGINVKAGCARSDEALLQFLPDHVQIRFQQHTVAGHATGVERPVDVGSEAVGARGERLPLRLGRDGEPELVLRRLHQQTVQDQQQQAGRTVVGVDLRTRRVELAENVGTDRSTLDGGDGAAGRTA